MPEKKKYRAAWQAALDVIRETDNPAVMTGDLGLLHMIAARMGWKQDGYRTALRVTAALNRTPGVLHKRSRKLGNGRVGSIFYLPECVKKEWMK